MSEQIIQVGALITALTVIVSTIFLLVRWVLKQNKHGTDLAELKEHHDKDMVKEAQDIQELRDELCVLSYGMLAALDGLKQLHCNGEVTKAHDMLSKHLNKQAHGQYKN